MKRIQYYLNARNETKRQNQMKFIEAVKEDDEATCRRLLEEGHVIFNHHLPIDTTKEENATYPLCVAAFYGSPKVINLLLEYGAHINYDYDTHRPIFWALSSVHASNEAIRLLLECGAKSPLLIEYLFNFERPEREMRNILHFILRNNIVIPEQVVSTILDKFFDNCLDLFAILFSITKNPNIINMNGDTVLFMISNTALHGEEYLENRLRTIKGLINLGVNPGQKNDYNFIAADFATHEDIRQLLLEHIPK